MSALSGRDGGVVGVQCQHRRRQDAVSVSSGRGVGVEIVDIQAVSATVHGTPHPSHSMCPS